MGDCERSIAHIFGAASGDPEGEKILNAMQSGPMTLTDLHHVFSKNRSIDWITAKIRSLVDSRKIVETEKDGERKSGIRAWQLAPKKASSNRD